MEDLQQQIKDLHLAKQSSSGSSSQQTYQQAMFLKAALDLEKGLMSAEVLLNGDVVTQVVSCLNSESTSTSVLEAATELVTALFTHDVVKKAVANKPRPIVDALFTCLRNNVNVSIVLQHIFTAIGNLTDHQDASQNWLVSDYDVISVVVNVLKQSPSLVDLQAQAYYALQKIAYRNKANIICLFNAHLAHHLALTSVTNHATNVFVQAQACTLLRRLSFIAETHSVLMTTATATVIQSMRSFAPEPQIQEHGCAFINNMAFNAYNRKLLVREPHFAHQVILSAMRNHPQIAAIQEEGCAALRNLSVDADNRKLLVREPHLAHQAILSAMCNHPQIASVQEEGCAALRNLSGDADNQKLLIREPHLAHHVILSAMHNHPQIAAVQEQGCGSLCNLAVDADNRKLLVQHDAHITVMAALKTHPQLEVVQLEAVWALTYFSYEPSTRAYLKQADALPLCEKAQRNFPNNEDLAARLATLTQNLA